MFAPDFAATADLSFDTATVVVWSLVEESSAVLCMNLPPCRHLIGRMLPGKHLLTTNNNATNAYRPSQWQSAPGGDGPKRTTTADTYSTTKEMVFAGKEFGSVTTISAAPGKDRPPSKDSIVSTVSAFVTVSESSQPSWPLTGSEPAVIVGGIPQRPPPPPPPRPVNGSRQLNVEIDRSELGMAEVLDAAVHSPARVRFSRQY